MIKSVSEQIDILARAENLPTTEYLNLKLAALFLYSGYITDYDSPLNGALLHVDELLPQFGFEQKTAEEVKMIIKNSFNDIIESPRDKIMHIAKYHCFCNTDRVSHFDNLRKEQEEKWIVYDDNEWHEMQSEIIEKSKL